MPLRLAGHRQARATKMCSISITAVWPTNVVAAGCMRQLTDKVTAAAQECGFQLPREAAAAWRQGRQELGPLAGPSGLPASLFPAYLSSCTQRQEGKGAKTAG